MRKVQMALVALLAVGLMLAAVGPAVGGPATTAGKKATVVLGDNFFSPASKKVKRKTLVRFKWTGKNKHNVVKKKGPGGTFASELTDKPGINYKKRFKKKGRYRLICTIHEKMKMTLKVR